MPSPQKENGYTPIAHEILDALARTPSLGSEAAQVLMLVFHYTYGFHRKAAEMSLTFVSNGTGLSRRNASRAIQRLVSKRILVKEGNTITFNKNHGEWVVSKRTPLVSNQTRSSVQTDTKVVSNRTPKKDKPKDKLRKIDIAPPPASRPPALNADEPMTREQFVEGCLKSPQRHVVIIGEWADTVRPSYTTRGQWNSYLKRNVRAAMQLVPFTEAQLVDAVERIYAEQDPKRGFTYTPTLDTVLKYLTK